MIAQAAVDARVRLRGGVAVPRVIRTDDGILVDGAEPTCVATVVDATGRTARIARSLGATFDQVDRLICAARVFVVGDQPVGDTFIESSPNGWWYASPLPEGRRLIAFFTDAAHAVQTRLATGDGWTMALVQTDYVRELAIGSSDDRVHVASCASHVLHPCAGRDWIAVGDAALAVDPLSSGGVAFALRSATAAVGVLLGGDRSAYDTFVADEASEYRQLRVQIYGWEQRFRDRDFWSARTEGLPVY